MYKLSNSQCYRFSARPPDETGGANNRTISFNGAYVSNAISYLNQQLSLCRIHTVTMTSNGPMFVEPPTCSYSLSFTYLYTVVRSMSKRFQ